MSKTDIQVEDANIKSAISAVASYATGRFKRELIERMTNDVEAEVYQARLAGAPIDTTGLFLRLAEKYAD